MLTLRSFGTERGLLTWDGQGAGRGSGSGGSLFALDLVYSVTRRSPTTVKRMALLSTPLLGTGLRAKALSRVQRLLIPDPGSLRPKTAAD